MRMPILYHFGGAICAQKVRLALAEKGIEFESRECNGPGLRDPAYLKLNPGGVVPTLVHGDLVIEESRIISEYINDAFDGPPLMPADAHERYRARYWSKQIDDSLHINVFVLTFLSFAREMFRQLPEDVRKTAMPGLRDPIKRRIANELYEQEWKTPWAAIAVERFQILVNEMDAWLAQSRYLAGNSYSLADADFTAYINRLLEMGLDQILSDKPSLLGWWDRMRARPSFDQAISAWQTPEDNERYARGRDHHSDELQRLVKTG